MSVTPRQAESRNVRDHARLVAEVKKLKPEHEPLSLRRYWRLGGKAMQLDRDYGRAQIQTLARETGCSKSVLYACLRFRQVYRKQSDLNRSVRRGLWGAE